MKSNLFILLIFLSISMFGQNYCGNDYKDKRDGTIYPTIQIYDHCWFAKNLNYGIILNSTDDQTNNMLTEKYCYEDNSVYCSYYGGLYQWDELMNYKTNEGGVCPEGWHVATKTEWEDMLSSTNNENLVDWISDSNTGFDLVYSGYKNDNEDFQGVHTDTRFWTSTGNLDSKTAYYVSISKEDNSVKILEGDISNSYSVRCVLNDNSAQINSIGYDNLLISEPIPNPAKTVTKFIYKLPVGVNIGHIIIYNILGNEVKRVQVDYTNHPVVLDVTKFNKGTYFYQLKYNNKKSSTKRLIIQ